MRQATEMYLSRAQMPDEAAMAEARVRWNAIAKPLFSLGLLEEMIIKIAGMTGTAAVASGKKCVLVFAADNGVVAEGVTQTDASVTAIVAENIAEGRASVNAMGRAAGADVFLVDVGVNARLASDKALLRKVRLGTGNIAAEPAMSRDEAEQALIAGIEAVRDMKEMGYTAIATGEMGIGNTTTSSALATVFLDAEIETVTGRGAGLSDAGLARKIDAIRRAIALHGPTKDDPLGALSAVGGLDIAAMAGAFIGGAVYRVPVIVDGFISGVAALVAAAICKSAPGFMLASHVSREPAGQMVLDALFLRPLIKADMALGEGTGAVALFPLMDMALSVYNQNSTFSDIGVAAYEAFPS